MGKCVGALHPNTFPYISPIPFDTRQHTSPLTPYTLPHPSPHIFPYLPPHPNTFPYTSPHTPHISSHSSPDLPLHPNTLPHSPHALFLTSPHIFSYSLDYVAKLPCDNVTLISLTGLWKSLIKFFTTTGNLKSCFGVGNVNF